MKRVLCLVFVLLLGAFAHEAGRADRGRKYLRHGHRSKRWRAAGSRRHAPGGIDRRPAAHDGHRRPGAVQVPQPRCRHLQGHDQSQRLQQDGTRRHRHHRRQRDADVSDGRKVGRGDGHGHRRDAGRRRQEDRNGDDTDGRGAAEHAAVEGSVGDAQDGTRRDRRSRECRRQRIRPAVGIRRQGRARHRHDVEPRRRRHHRHDIGRRIVARTSTSTRSTRSPSTPAATI